MRGVVLAGWPTLLTEKPITEPDNRFSFPKSFVNLHKKLHLLLQTNVSAEVVKSSAFAV